MKKMIVLLGSMLIAFGLKAQTTKPAKKETTKPVTAATSVTPKPAFRKAPATTKAVSPASVAPTRVNPVVQKKAVQPAKRQ